MAETAHNFIGGNVYDTGAWQVLNEEGRVRGGTATRLYRIDSRHTGLTSRVSHGKADTMPRQKRPCRRRSTRHAFGTGQKPQARTSTETVATPVQAWTAELARRSLTYCTPGFAPSENKAKNKGTRERDQEDKASLPAAWVGRFPSFAI